MTEKVSQPMHTRMEFELLNYINMGMKWNIMKKGRTSITRRPRKPGSDGFKLVYNMQESTAFERKKSGLLKVVDVPSKKRRLLHQSTSPSPQTMFVNGEGCLWSGPQTPSVLHEDSGHRSNSRSKSQKTKSKTGLRNNKMKRTKKPHDFSGIELLADVACSSLIQAIADHVECYSMLKEHTTPEVKSCMVDTKEAAISPGSNGSSVQQNVPDSGKEVEEKKVDTSKGLRLHWDLNTVMDEWDVARDDLVIEPVKLEDGSNSVPVVENCNVDSFEETYESVEDLEVGTKTVTVKSKTSDGESSASKSEVVDPLTHPVKCEDHSTSTTSVLKEQNGVNYESETIDGPKLDHQPASECCSNVTQEQGIKTELDPDDKIQAGYDSPFEDGELREPIGKPEKETVYNESDDTYKGDFDTTESPLLGKVERGQTVGETAPETEQGVKADTSGRPHTDEPTPFDVCMNGESIQRSRSSNMGETSTRSWDLKSHRSLDRSYPRHSGYGSYRGGGYRAQERRPSPPERNSGYGSYKGPPPARSHSGERYRFHSQDYYDRKLCYPEPKPQFSSSFNQPSTHCRSRSRSRSGSPIAWHFQKRKNSDSSNPSGEFKPETERLSKSIDDHHRFRDGHFRDKREAPVTSQQSQQKRYDPIGYPERSKPDDYFRYNQRPGRFSQGYKYKDYNEDIRKHDGYYEKVNRVGRDDDDGGARRFRYAHNR